LVVHPPIVDVDVHVDTQTLWPIAGHSDWPARTPCSAHPTPLIEVRARKASGTPPAWTRGIQLRIASLAPVVVDRWMAASPTRMLRDWWGAPATSVVLVALGTWL
jgi:hypothetical protein